MSSCNMNFVVFLVLILCTIISEAYQTMNKIRVCGGSLNQSYEVFDTSCRRGVWMPQPVQAGCICVTGTWLLMENYCDSNFYIVSGPSANESSGAGTQFSCFELSKDVYKDNHFNSDAIETNQYKHYIMQNNGKFIAALEKSDLSYIPDGEVPVVVVRLNANREFYMSHKAGVHSDIWQKCLGTQKSKPYTHIIKSDESISFLKSMRGEQTCDDVKDDDFPYTMSNNTEWLIDEVSSYAWGTEDGFIEIGNCSCNPPPVPGSFVVTNTLTGHATGLQNLLHNTDIDYDYHPGDSFSLYPKKKDPLVHAEHLKDNARTTASILSKLKDFLFSGAQAPPFPNPLFDYIRQGRNILTNFCPEIPSDEIRTLVGMFRLLLTDVIKKHPEEYSLNIDTGVHQRVLESLNKCNDQVAQTPAKFFWKDKDSEASKTSEKCISGKMSKREIISAEVDGKSIPISMANIPHDIRFVDGDVMLEVAWKILLVTHYVCSPHFQEYPEDLSFMFVKAQEFLTIPNVMFRWENPAYGLTAAYKILAPKLNAHELGQQIDACLFVAFEKSSFNTWLGRPESSSEFIPGSVVKSAMDKLTGNNNTEGNNQKNVYSILGDTGFCVKEFNDPITMSLAEDHMAGTIGITGC